MTTITAPIPLFWAGRNIANIRITPCTVNFLTGVLTKGTPFDIAVSESDDNVRLSQSVDLEMIKAANSTMNNNVPIADDFDVEVGEIKGNSGNAQVMNAWVGFDYFLLEVITSPDGGTTEALVQAVCIRAGFDDEYGERKSVNVLRGKPCGLPIAYIPLDTGTPTPIY